MLIEEFEIYTFCSVKNAILELGLWDVYREIYDSFFEDTLLYDKLDYVDDHDIPRLKQVLKYSGDIFTLEIDEDSSPIVIKITLFVPHRIAEDLP